MESIAKTDNRLDRCPAHLTRKVLVPAPSASLFALFLSMAGTAVGDSNTAGVRIDDEL